MKTIILRNKLTNETYADGFHCMHNDMMGIILTLEIGEYKVPIEELDNYELIFN